MHRIGRTGRAEEEGKTILFYTKTEVEAKEAIEALMEYEIPMLNFPNEVEISQQLIPEERPKEGETKNYNRNIKEQDRGPSFHEKKDKNKKVNLGGSYKRKIKKKYKKPKSRGDKNFNKKR
jgi:ATP-dependent RNA helicase RhlE